MIKSESIKLLAVDLLKAQKEMKFAKKDAVNPFFKSKYADLPAVIEAIKEPLNNNNIVFVQLVQPEGVETMFLHTSGEFISGVTPILLNESNNPQALGSAITYAKRYGLQAITGLPTEDDDGESAMGRGKPGNKSSPINPAFTKACDDNDLWSKI